MFLEIINFLLLVRTPEIHVHIPAGVHVAFDPFADQEIFPNGAGILPKLRQVKVVDQSISDARIVEVDLTEFFQLISKVTAEWRKVKNHKSLFKKIDVIGNRLLVDVQQRCKLRIGHFITHLKGQSRQQSRMRR